MEEAEATAVGSPKRLGAYFPFSNLVHFYLIVSHFLATLVVASDICPETVFKALNVTTAMAL